MPFVWNPQHGILEKLKKYCLYFSEFFPFPDKKKNTLYLTANQAWLHGIQCMNQLRFLSKNPALPDAEDLLRQNLLKLIRSIRLVGHKALQTMPLFHLDENVAFFILRNRKHFDEIFGADFAKNLQKNVYGRHPRGGRFYGSKIFSQRLPQPSSPYLN